MSIVIAWIQEKPGDKGTKSNLEMYDNLVS